MKLAIVVVDVPTRSNSPHENLARNLHFEHQFSFAHTHDERRSLLLEHEAATKHKAEHRQRITQAVVITPY